MSTLEVANAWGVPPWEALAQMELTGGGSKGVTTHERRRWYWRQVEWMKALNKRSENRAKGLK